MSAISLPELLCERARSQGDAPYLVDYRGGTVTYGEADVGARTWAAALRTLGLGAGDTILSMQPNRPGALMSWLGAAWLGAMDVGVNTDYRGSMLSYVVAHSQAATAVVGEEYVSRLLESLDEGSKLRTIVVPDAVGALPDGGGVTVVAAEDILRGPAPREDLTPPSPWDICYIIYTSGTTGPSKGVLTPWEQLHAQTLACLPIEELGPDDAYYCPFSLAHGGGRMPAYLMALVGGRLVVRDRFSGSDFWSDVRKHGCTATALLGAMSAFLMHQPPQADDSDNPMRSVVMLPLLPEHLEFAERFGVRLRTTFSMTEISVPIVSDWDPADHRSCGKVREGYPGVDVRIVDEHDMEVPEGSVGELIVRTSEPWTMNAGYFRMPEATVAAWRNGWFHTGDGFTRDAEGRLYFVDRVKDAIRRRGENISSFEVEAGVNAHPDVVESAAVAVPSEWGEDEVKIYVVRAPGSTLTAAELVDWLEPRMTPFMIPRYVEFRDDLPKTEATLRVRKVALRASGINEHTWDRLAAPRHNADR